MVRLYPDVLECLRSSVFLNYTLIVNAPEFQNGYDPKDKMYFDTFMIQEADLSGRSYNAFRSMEANKMVFTLPFVNTCFLVSSNDVLHS
jgi:hypothetical protein